MSKMLLAVDIGNTTIQCGVFEGEALKTSWRLSSPVSRTPDECWQSISFFLGEAGLTTDSLGAMGVASVVPEHTAAYTAMATARFDRDPLVISVDSCSFLDVRYRDPRQIGADRLCNAFAGYRAYGGPLIVVDFGTAITFDIIDEGGAYLGGVIMPGPRTAAGLLHKRTAQLPRVSLDFPERIIGDTTEDAIRSGLTWGIVDMIDGLIERLAEELNGKPQVVATGGWAKGYSKRSRNFSLCHPDLTLEGIRLIHERARSDS